MKLPTDATGGYGAFWVRDWSYMIEGCPEAFTREEIRDGYLFLAAAQRDGGVIHAHRDGVASECAFVQDFHGPIHLRFGGVRE